MRKELQIEWYILLMNHPEAGLKHCWRMPVGLEDANLKKKNHKKIKSILPDTFRVMIS